MRKILLIIPCMVLGLMLTAQDKIAEKSDSTKIKMGDGEIIFVGFDDNKCNKDSMEYSWTTLAVDLGMNGYLTSDNSLTMPSEYSMMELNYSKSYTLGLSMMLSKADIIKDKLYISPGIGIVWNNYHFENDISISTGSDSTIFMNDSLNNYRMQKLNTTSLQLPLVIGARIGSGKHPLGIQVGVIGSFKIGSKLKQKLEMDGTTYKTKIKDDYNLNPLSLDAIVRVAIGDVGIYARYALTPMFEKNKTAELQPFSIGFTFGGFMKQKKY